MPKLCIFCNLNEERMPVLFFKTSKLKLQEIEFENIN